MATPTCNNGRIDVDAKTYWMFKFRFFLTKKQKEVLIARIFGVLND